MTNEAGDTCTDIAGVGRRLFDSRRRRRRCPELYQIRHAIPHDTDEKQHSSGDDDVKDGSSEEDALFDSEDSEDVNRGDDGGGAGSSRLVAVAKQDRLIGIAAAEHEAAPREGTRSTNVQPLVQVADNLEQERVKQTATPSSKAATSSLRAVLKGEGGTARSKLMEVVGGTDGTDAPTPTSKAATKSLVAVVDGVVDGGGQFQPGMRVEAKVAGWTKHYPGEVTHVNGDGTYDIRFDDGEEKKKVKVSQIRSAGGQAMVGRGKKHVSKLAAIASGIP